VRLTLLSRSYCHLCEEMRAALAAAFPHLEESLEVLDVDADPVLEARYGDLVPVLLADGKEICHYHFDALALTRHLNP
jgi:hypothetical protein